MHSYDMAVICKCDSPIPARLALITFDNNSWEIQLPHCCRHTLINSRVTARRVSFEEDREFYCKKKKKNRSITFILVYIYSVPMYTFDCSLIAFLPCIKKLYCIVTFCSEFSSTNINNDVI